MADRRISVLSDYTTLTGMYVALDKPGAIEAVRAPFMLIDPRSIYRCNTETVASGITTIVFGVGAANPFPVGTIYGFAAIWAIPTDTNEGAFLITPINLTIDGFDVNVPMACTFLYVAIIKN